MIPKRVLVIFVTVFVAVLLISSVSAFSLFDWFKTVITGKVTSSCVSEGGAIPIAVPEPLSCCSGLTLIPPLSSNMTGISGFCTAKCGDGACAGPETTYNCPADCKTPFVNSTCTDSDGGINLYIRGTVSAGSSSGTDCCALITANSSRPACSTNSTGNAIWEYSCDSTSKVSGNLYSCPNGCSNGACINQSSATTTTCTDSDGLDYYNAGHVCNNANDPACAYDYCVNSTVLKEAICSSNGNFADVLYSCPNGCSDGACINQTIEPACASEGVSVPVVANPNVCCPGLSLIPAHQGAVGISGYCTAKCGDGVCDSPVEDDYNCPKDCSSTNNTSMCKDSDGGLNYYVKGDTFGRRFSTSTSPDTESDSCLSASILTEYTCGGGGFPLDVRVSNQYVCPNGCSNGACLNETVRECSQVINDIKSPASFTDDYDMDFRLTQNNSYNSSWYTGGNSDYVIYEAGWNANDDASNMYYYIYKSILVFDDVSVNASAFISDLTKYNTCVEREISGKIVYVCNYDTLGADDYKYLDIMWANNNNLVRTTLSVNSNALTDEERARIADLRTQQLVEGIKDNRYQSTSQQFDIDYHFISMLDKMLSSCPSSLSEGVLPSYYECKLEPVVCPEHGTQNKICTSYANGQQQVTSSVVYCSPGICSGCYVPRWLGSKGDDNVCIPYGFRFAAASGTSVKLVEGQSNEAMYEGQSDSRISLNIFSDSAAVLTIMSKEGTNYTYNLTEGAKVDITDAIAGENSNMVSMILTIVNIIPATAEQQGSVTFVVNYQENEETVNTFNAYCDYDGQVKAQKSKTADGSWEACQNNYECTSNFCSNGECLDTQTAMKQASGMKKLLVSVLCRLSSLFNGGSYEECAANF